MKALHKMDNLDRGHLLCTLFPDQLINIQDCVKNECNYFLENETELRGAWMKTGFFTADFWYFLVKNAYKKIEIENGKLRKKNRSFSDFLFDGHQSIFTIHCLINYSNSNNCDEKLRLAIHLFFGKDSILKVINN